MMDMDNTAPLVRVWLFGAFHVERRAEDGGWESIEKSHWEKGYIRSFFKRLLSAHRRRLDRFTLIDDLWPDPENAEPLERYLNDAAYKLRKALRPAEVLHTFGHGSGYQLANQSLLWTDADACEALIGEAERIGRTSAPALPLLEQARDYVARGDYLEGENGLWVYARRGTLERLHYRCLTWLAESYEQQGIMGEAEKLYNALLEENPADEDALCRLMGLLHRQHMTSQALRCYEEAKKQLKHLGQRLSPATETFVKHLLNEPRQVEVYPMQRISQSVSPAPEQSSFLTVLPSTTDSKLENIPVKNRMLEQLSERVASLNTDTETLDYFEKLTEVCRHLSEGSELKLAERILWTYLPKLEATARLSLENQHEVADITSQGYLLAASLVGHQNDLKARHYYSEQALLYGKLAKNRNLQVAALRQLSITFDYLDSPEKVVQIYQHAIPYLEETSPLLHACVYSGVSGAYAQMKQKQEAQRYMSLAYEHFPTNPENEPGFLQTICRYSTLVFFDGLNYLELGQAKEAEKILARIDGLQPKIQIPERVRVELLNYQIEVFIALGNLEQACTYLEAATKASLILGSKRHFQESFALF